MSEGKSIHLFLADGTPGGLLTAEIPNWTGHVVAAPRSKLATLLRRAEISKTGVYLLLGDDPENLGRSLAYIGEGDSVADRLRQHAREDRGGKDFWDRAVVVTGKDEKLTKAHARYLESCFIEFARQASRARLLNGTSPPRPALPEADRSDMEYFIAQVQIILPVLGVNILRSAVVSSDGAGAESRSARASSPVFFLHFKKEGITATAREIDGEFTVLEGSGARTSWTGPKHTYKTLHERLVDDGVLVPEPGGTVMRFARSHVFRSPSAAAAVVTGRQANGRVDWKAEGSGISFGDWQVQGIDQVAAGRSPAVPG